MQVQVRRDFLGETTATADAKTRRGRAARVHSPGDALHYPWGEEYRDDEELRRVAAALVGKPVLLMHPDDSPENFYGLVGLGAVANVVGVVADAVVLDNYVDVGIAFDSDVGPRAVRQGFKDLSMGYQCRRDERGYQRDTVVDHLALVRRGRCRGPGGACELRGDSAACGCETEVQDEVVESVQGCDCNTLANPLDVGQPATHMPLASNESQEKALMDEMTKKLADAHAEAAVQMARADQAEKTRDAEKVRADQAEKDRDAAKTEAFNARKDAETALASVDAEKARADQAEKDSNEKVEKATADANALAEKTRTDAAAELDSRIAAKVALCAEAFPIIGTNEKGETIAVHTMTDRAIKIAVVQRVDAEDLDKLDPKPSDEFIAGVYAGAVKRHARAAGSRGDTARAVAAMRSGDVVLATTPAVNPEKKAMEDMRTRMSVQWQTPTATDTKDKE